MSLTSLLLVVIGLMLLGNTIFGGLPGRLVTYAEAHGAVGAPAATTAASSGSSSSSATNGLDTGIGAAAARAAGLKKGKS